MNDFGNRGFQAEIGAIGVDAGIVRKTLRMAAEADLIVRLIEIPGADDEFGLIIALESGSRRDIKNAVGAITIIGGVTAALGFDVIDVLGIDLRTDIASDVRVGDGNAVDEPAHLMAAANVELIVRHVRAGNEIGDHRQAVGAIGAGSRGDLRAIDDACGCGGFGDDLVFFFRNFYGLRDGGDVQLEVKDRRAVGKDRDALYAGLKAGLGHADIVISNSDSVESEFAALVGNSLLREIRSHGRQRDCRPGDWAVLRVMDQAADRTENAGVSECGD